ncbi:hypothetical protein MNBD_GAMMA24-1234 [hydrothermal vent metagenome]|uniref:N-acetyltransferase domain-containing protein n=1 Tax=hydrothermal vent metagenome TaxID=652676 RepID=A0A3B1BLN5_9ZZZZ
MTAAIIRTADEADIPSMLSLLEELFFLEPDFSFYPLKAEQGMRDLLQRPQSAVIFVLEVDRQVLGMASLQVLISTAEGGEVGLVEDVVIMPEYRERGLGKRLIAHIEAWAHERGLRRLQLLADRENNAAHRFYENVGWHLTRLRVFCRKDLN